MLHSTLFIISQYQSLLSNNMISIHYKFSLLPNEKIKHYVFKEKFSLIEFEQYIRENHASKAGWDVDFQFFNVATNEWIRRDAKFSTAYSTILVRRCVKSRLLMTTAPLVPDSYTDAMEAAILQEQFRKNNNVRTMKTPPPAAKRLDSAKTLIAARIPNESTRILGVPKTLLRSNMVVSAIMRDSLKDRCTQRVSDCSIPSTMKCPLNGQVMEDAVLTPCCSKVVSYASISNILYRDKFRCPFRFCDKPLSPDNLLVCESMRRQVNDLLYPILPNNANQSNRSF